MYDKLYVRFSLEIVKMQKYEYFEGEMAFKK